MLVRSRKCRRRLRSGGDILSGFACLYFGPEDECWNCGGFTKAEGGPFEGDRKFCSEDCFADYQERYRLAAEGPAWCPACGYDQGEHALDCGQDHASAVAS